MSNKISNGDLVYVKYLPKGMSHFDVGIGIVCKKGKAGFFIHFVDKNFKPKPNHKSGWYKDSNVGVLAKGYLRGNLDGKNVYRNIPTSTLNRRKKEADKVMNRLKIICKKHNKDFTDFIFGRGKYEN